MKKIAKFLLAFLLIMPVYACGKDSSKLPKASPDSESTFGVDKNINIKTIDKYLNREDTVYRDMRMLDDPANYCNIGGDAKLSGTIKGFEVVPYPYLATVTGLPEAVGLGYTGETLFALNENGTYTANYEESLMIIEDLFPRDKNIILMCGGGGYAMMTKNLLVYLGYDASKIYNIGGYWDYKGSNQVKVDVTYGDGFSNYYAFHRLKYHIIDFTYLNEITAEN